MGICSYEHEANRITHGRPNASSVLVPGLVCVTGFAVRGSEYIFLWTSVTRREIGLVLSQLLTALLYLRQGHRYYILTVALCAQRNDHVK